MLSSAFCVFSVILCVQGQQFGGFDYYDYGFGNSNEKYKGKYIADLSTFHHQVN